MDDVISIPNIGIQKIGVNEISIPNITSTVPVYQPPPVVVNIGVPIVDMPGCVKYHPDAKKNREQPNLKRKTPKELGCFVMQTIQHMMRWIIHQKI